MSTSGKKHVARSSQSQGGRPTSGRGGKEAVILQLSRDTAVLSEPVSLTHDGPAVSS